MTLVTSLPEICEVLQTKLEDNKLALGVEALFYGDQNKVPVTPAVCIEPGSKTNVLKGAQRQISIEFEAYILVYHSLVTSPQTNRRGSDEMAEAIETLIHADPRLERADGSDRVIHSMITEISSGYVDKGGSVLRASRLTFSALSQDLLPG